MIGLRGIMRGKTGDGRPRPGRAVPEDGLLPEGGRIRSMDGYAHLVDGKTICFERHMFSLSSEADRDVLSRVAAGLPEGGSCVLSDTGDGSGNFFQDMAVPGSRTA